MATDDEKVEKITRVNLRIPNETFAELATYGARSGFSRTQFMLHGLIVGCRLLDQMSFPQYHMTPEQLQSAMAGLSDRVMDHIEKKAEKLPEEK